MPPAPIHRLARSGMSHPGLRPPRQVQASGWLAFALVSTFFLYEFVVRVEPSLAARGIMAHFGIGEGAFGTLVSLFFWVYAPMQLVVGMTLDRFGARRVVVPAVLICALGPLLFAASDSLWLAAVGRGLMGLGGAFGFVGALYVASHHFPARMFATLSGLLAAVGMIGTAVGLVWLTRLIGDFGWREVFQGTGLAGLLLFVLVFFLLREPPEGATGRAANNPLRALPGLMRNGRLWLIAVVSALYYVPVNVYAGLWGKSELMRDHGLDALSAEFAVSMIFWGLAVGGIVAGVVSDRMVHRKWLLVSGALACAGVFAIALVWPTGDAVTLAALMLLAGFLGGPQVLTFAMAKEGLPGAVAGTALALVNMIAVGGAMLFQPIASYILQLSGGNYQVALIPVFGAPVVAAVLAAFIREERHPDHAPHPARGHKFPH